jgi:hypothetical protein
MDMALKSSYAALDSKETTGRETNPLFSNQATRSKA